MGANRLTLINKLTAEVIQTGHVYNFSAELHLDLCLRFKGLLF